jgi:hypothetical protein
VEYDDYRRLPGKVLLFTSREKDAVPLSMEVTGDSLPEILQEVAGRYSLIQSKFVGLYICVEIDILQSTIATFMSESMILGL